MNSILQSYENALSVMKNIYYEDGLKKLAKIMHERRIFSTGMENQFLLKMRRLFTLLKKAYKMLITCNGKTVVENIVNQLFVSYIMFI